jgi:lysophospholipase L1-like esterase
MLATENQDDGLILVVCAGENDIGQGIPLESSVQALQKVLDAAFTPPSGANNTTLHHLVFLGPKLEPWMNDDLDSKKSYSAMDRAFQRCCMENVPTMVNNLHYVDCLVMFCGETANVSGARLGGKAIAQEEFFDADQLHLNDSGYVIWKDVVEDMIIKKCL